MVGGAWRRNCNHGALCSTCFCYPASGFVGTTLALGRFGEIDVFNHFILPNVPQAGHEGHERHKNNIWLSSQKTKGLSDVYVQNNVWQPGGSTGWHTHPGHSLIIVTAGTITAYEGDDPECKPTVHTQEIVAQTIAVQLIPAHQGRRIDVAAPRKLPLLTRAERLAAATSDPWDAYLVPRPGIAAAVDRGRSIYAVQQYRTTEDDG